MHTSVLQTYNALQPVLPLLFVSLDMGRGFSVLSGVLGFLLKILGFLIPVEI